MYRITCDGITLYEPDNPVLQLISGTLKTGQNIAGTLTFVLAPTHPYLSRIKARSSIISVYRDGVLYFRGSPLNVTESDTGLVTVTAEGALAWLGDSVQPFAEYHNMTVRTYLETLVKNHNVAVQDDAYKQFTVGEVTVTDSNDSLYRHSNFEHTKDAITEKLTKRLGGILRVRWKNSVQYLDYLAEYKHVNGQGIKFGQNLLTYARSVPTANLATAIIPLGCKLTDADGNETDERLQIDNGGKNYVWDEKAVQEFGWIFDTIICDDVTLKENLSKRGYSELEARKVLPTTIKLTAVDFGALGGNYERITVGDLLPIVSTPHNLDTYMAVAEMTENLVDPGKSTVTLNRTYKTVTSGIASVKKELGQEFDLVKSDMQKRTDKVQQELTDYKVDARKDMDSITASVTETRTELTTTTENVYDALGRLQDTAVSTEELESVKQLLITQWSDQLEYRFTQVTNLIDSTNGTIAENQRLLEQYIRFEGARITLGRSDSAIQAVLSNDRLEFVENGQTIAYISNRMLYITDAHITGSLSFGNADTGLYMWRYNAEADTFDLEFEGDD